MLRLIGLLFFVCTHLFLIAQEAKENVRILPIQRADTPIKIDAHFDEFAWQKAIITKDFIQNEPYPGNAANQTTEVRIIYDDKAIYIAANLYDSRPDSILQQLSERDRIGITDWFGVVLDPYRFGLNGSGFIVTAAGVQFDTKYSALDGGSRVNGGDRSWDAVWESATRFTEKGWAVEIKLPYSALRFPKEEIQTWGINFARMVRRNRELTFWNEVNPQLQGLLNQSGQLTGIQHIKSPVRLSATPFLAYYAENYTENDGAASGSWDRSLSGGMDIKYGINDAFTLDVTLIPDFGQAQSDNQVLNLSPFEVRFDENRPFFTEGTELFNKGGLFYSRRVGGRPIGYYDVGDQLGDDEEIKHNPSTTPLINATKVSGRTTNGLGIGVFNATSRRTYATIENKETKEERTVVTAPLTNYNVTVFDQSLKNNSYVTLINTNVWRAGSAYEANVTGTEFSIRNAKNTYAFNGGGALSQQYYEASELVSGADSVGLGHRYELEFEKTSGNFQYSTGYTVSNEDYDINDLGINFRPNQETVWLSGNYNIFKPFGPFNRAGAWSNMRYSRLHAQHVFTDFRWNIRSFFVTKSFFAFGLFGAARPFNSFDYFEPRSGDFSRFYKLPKNGSIGFWGSSDYRKLFAYDFDAEVTSFAETGRRTLELTFGPRWRASDKLSFRLDIEFENRWNDIGYVSPREEGLGYSDMLDEDIIFSRRDQRIFDNTLSGNYIFTNNMSLTLRARHYWTRLDYRGFNLLDERGGLADTPYKGYNLENQPLHNTSFNIFNIDMVYRWRFAPGSDIFFVWKNSIFNDSPNIDETYLHNLANLLDAPQRNNFSVKIVYFLDYIDMVPST